MTDQQRLELERIALEASGLPPDERNAFLDARISELSPLEQEELRKLLEALLSSDTLALGFLDKPPDQLETWIARSFPETIGPYRILEVIGEGGMGVVYRAEQPQPRRTVALKVIRPGMGSPQLMQRLVREAQALGRLQHPGIAQIYYAGTADAGYGPQPYFAMEFVEGRGLLEFAADLPDTQARMELMARLCEAVSHAHQQGVIHRDLKPSNVVVTPAGQPKVLDFGAARMSGPDDHLTLRTEFGQIIGTLAYMSPEQASGTAEDIDARTDVYSLGVILYQILAGKLPCSTSGLSIPEAVRVIREEEPSLLGSVSRPFCGDIETIAAKALEKEKHRRYQSVAAMAEDIGRYLADKPILARAPGSLYRLRKFARRNREVVWGAAAVMLVLLAGIAASSWQTVRALRAEKTAENAARVALQQQASAVAAEKRALAGEASASQAQRVAEQQRNTAIQEKLRADTEAASASAIASFLQGDLLAQASVRAQSAAPDRDLTVRTALDRAASAIGSRFQDRPAVEASLRDTIGWTYRGLGLYPEARAQTDRAVELLLRQQGPNHPKTLEVRSRQGQIALDQGLFAEAESILAPTLQAQRKAGSAGRLQTMQALAQLYQRARYKQAEFLRAEAVDLVRKKQGPEHRDTQTALLNLAASYRQRGDFALAESVLRQVLEVSRRTLGADHPDTLDCMYTLATVLVAWGKEDQATPLLTEAVARFRRVFGPDHPSTLLAMFNLGISDLRTGRFAEAESLFTRTLESRRRQLGVSHQQTLLAMHLLGLAYLAAGRYADAEIILRQTVDLRRGALGPNHPQTTRGMFDLGDALRLQRKYLEADALLSQALQLRVAKAGREDEVAVLIRNTMANAWRDQGRHADAEAMLLKVLEMSHGTDEHTPHTMAKHEADLALTYLEHGKLPEAERMAREALAIGKAKEPQGWRRFASESLLGQCLAAQKKYAEAEPLLVNGLKGLDSLREQIPAPDRYLSDPARERLAQLYRAWGKPGQRN